MRIVFFGTPRFAVPSLEAILGSRDTVAAVISQPDRPKGRGQQLQPTPTRQIAEAHGVPIVQPAKVRDPAFLDAIRAFTPDLGVVVAFGRILSDELLRIPRLGMINVHASLLPKYRGAAPVQRAVLAGERETGVTIMRLEAELDAGPTFAMQAVPIPPEATSGDLEAVLAVEGARLLLPVIADLASGRATETPQDHSQATFAPKVTKEEGPIDWTATAGTIHNRVRGLQPWPLASTTIHGVRCVIRRTLETPATSAGGRAATPGTVIQARGDALVIACGNGTALRVLELQPEGRRSMMTRDFLAGRGPLEGERLGP